MKKIIKKQHYLPTKKEYSKLLDLIDKNNKSGNALSAQLEEELKKYLRVQHVLLFPSISSAFRSINDALGGSEGVITSPIIHPSIHRTLQNQGLAIDYADIQTHNYSLNPVEVEKHITKNTSYILAQHTFGVPADVYALASLAEKYNLKIIYDVTDAVGVDLGELSLTRFGDISVIRLNTNQIFHTISGAAIISNNTDLIQSINSARHLPNNIYEWVEEPHAPIPQLNAAIGLVQLGKLSKGIMKRKEIHEIYYEYLGNLVGLPKLPELTLYNYAYFPMLMRSDIELQHVKKALEDLNIHSKDAFSVDITSELTKSRIFEDNELITAQSVIGRILCLPNSQFVSVKEAQKIAQTTEKVVKEFRKIQRASNISAGKKEKQRQEKTLIKKVAELPKKLSGSKFSFTLFSIHHRKLSQG